VTEGELSGGFPPIDAILLQANSAGKLRRLQGSPLPGPPEQLRLNSYCDRHSKIGRLPRSIFLGATPGLRYLTARLANARVSFGYRDVGSSPERIDLIAGSCGRRRASHVDLARDGCSDERRPVLQQTVDGR
jgi:hypothetical protein